MANNINVIDPAISEISTIIRLTDQLRLLDQDMIRLQQKVNTVLELQEKEVIDEKEMTKEREQEELSKLRLLWGIMLVGIILFIAVFVQNSKSRPNCA